MYFSFKTFISVYVTPLLRGWAIIMGSVDIYPEDNYPVDIESCTPVPSLINLFVVLLNALYSI